MRSGKPAWRLVYWGDRVFTRKVRLRLSGSNLIQIAFHCIKSLTHKCRWLSLLSVNNILCGSIYIHGELHSLPPYCLMCSLTSYYYPLGLITVFTLTLSIFNYTTIPVKLQQETPLLGVYHLLSRQAMTHPGRV